MKKLLLSVLLITLLGCKEESQQLDFVDDPEPTPTPEAGRSAIDGFPELREGLEFYDLGENPLTDPEDHNVILVCLKGGQFCWSSCVSAYFPSVERFSVFKSYWLEGNKCVAHVIQWPNGVDIPKYFYYLGRYQSQAPNYCVIDSLNPDFEGRAFFDEVRVLEGEVTPHPHHRRLYEIHNIFDLDSNFITSIMMMRWRPPAGWEYLDPEIDRGTITIHLQAGFACIRRDQIQ